MYEFLWQARHCLSARDSGINKRVKTLKFIDGYSVFEDCPLIILGLSFLISKMWRIIWGWPDNLIRLLSALRSVFLSCVPSQEPQEATKEKRRDGNRWKTVVIGEGRLWREEGYVICLYNSQQNTVLVLEIHTHI